MKAIPLPKNDENVLTGGIVTLEHWTMMPDGASYMYLFSDHWEVLTDAQIANSLPGFRSAEHWSLAGLNGKGEMVVLIPGCQVKGWALSPKAPPNPGCYVIE